MPPPSDNELCRAIAEAVMEWRWWQYRPDIEQALDPSFDIEQAIGRRWLINPLASILSEGSLVPADMSRPPRYATGEFSYPDWLGRDWRQVVTRMLKLGWDFDLHLSAEYQIEHHACRAGFTHSGLSGRSASTWASDIGHAVCLAALQAVHLAPVSPGDPGGPSWNVRVSL